MTAPDETALPIPSANTTAAHASVAMMERLANGIGSRASVTVVYGEPVSAAGVTVIPVAKVGFGFGGGTGSEAGAAKAGDGGGGGGKASARPCGFIEIKNGSATYKPLRNPWLDALVPLAALVAGTAVPGLARRLAERRLK
ncbi:spore germination protein GerW family protein [Streptomyces syringium]|uniref:spore germination protein GerW family protein n=1 Tax=Streptomyces syringium TaxID=76729 RepID=UPI0033D168BD